MKNESATRTGGAAQARRRIMRPPVLPWIPQVAAAWGFVTAYAGSRGGGLERGSGGVPGGRQDQRGCGRVLRADRGPGAAPSARPAALDPEVPEGAERAGVLPEERAGPLPRVDRALRDPAEQGGGEA